MLSVEELNDRLIDLAFAEDIGDGDHTTLCCIPKDAMGKSKLLIKEEGILAGVEIAKEVFRRFDPEMQVEVFLQDGAHVKPGDVAMVVTGRVQSLLQTERLMLNIMQRMSGIATMTHKYVERLEGTKTRVLDTRKTTPGMRMLEKAAVKIGGGMNHHALRLVYDEKVAVLINYVKRYIFRLGVIGYRFWNEDFHPVPRFQSRVFLRLFSVHRNAAFLGQHRGS